MKSRMCGNDCMGRLWKTGVFWLIAVMWLSAPLLAVFENNTLAIINLGANGSDFAYDRSRNMLYVSIPSRNEVAFVSLNTMAVVDRRFIGSSPMGVELSRDGSQLFVALNQAAAVGTLQLDTLRLGEIVVGGSNGLGSSLAYDVIEAAPGRLFVSANPGSGGFSYIAQVDLTNGNAVSRVASDRIIRASPKFLGAPDGSFLYVGEGFSPNSLYRLDLSQVNAPITLEDDHGTVSGTQLMDISPDGSRIYLSSGQVLRAESFLQAGRIGAGIPSVSKDGSSVFVASSSKLIDVYSSTTFLKTDSISLPTSSQSVINFDLLSTNSVDFGFALLRGQELVLSVPEPCTLLLLGLGGALIRQRGKGRGHK